jgi:hypothetical protein
MNVVSGERSTERAARIAGRRLDPYVAERTVTQDLAVGHAIERDAARQT